MSTMIYFDSLEYVEALKTAGMPEPQAKALAKVQQKSLSECLDTTLATKTDLLNLEKATRADFINFEKAAKEDLLRLEKAMKADLINLEKATKADLHKSVNKLENRMDRLDGRMHKLESTVTLHSWMLGVLLAGVGSLVLKAFF